ncbi:MAG: hypothetical protein J1E58_08210 [Prevotella sp.]|nr:hypothetical protein [Prevotella sp.]
MEKLINAKRMSLNFNLREPRGNKCTNVYAVIKVEDKQLKLSTGCKINSWQWDRKRQTPIITPEMTDEDRMNALRLMDVICQIRSGYLGFFSHLCNGGAGATEKEIKAYLCNHVISRLDGEEMESGGGMRGGMTRSPKATTLLNKAFEIYYSEVKTSIKATTTDTNRSRLKAFELYCEQIGEDKMSMLTQRGLNEYKTWLIRKSKEARQGGGVRYDSNRSINNKCELIERLINKVMVSHTDFLRYRIEAVRYVQLEEVNAKGEDKKRRPLKEDELSALMNCGSLTAEEREYRDLFILECNGSYRIGDTPKLFDRSRQQHYRKGKYELIVIDTEKEGITSVIWVNDIVRKILGRYAGGFRYANPSLGGNSYKTKYNEMIKRIARKAGLNSVERWVDVHGDKNEDYLYNIISSHFARYTFIYNGLFVLGMMPSELKDFTGHADDRMIQEVYTIYSTDEKVNNAVRALERVLGKNS